MKFWTEPTSKHAFILSIISVVVTLVAAVIGIAFWKKFDSALCLVFGLENCVDLFSSIIVVWRFFAIGEVTKEREEFLMKREKRASMAISFVLIMLGIFVSSGAIDDLAAGPESKADLDIILEISLISIVVFGALTIFKFNYSKKLNSASLYKDGLCSMFGTALSGALVFNTLIIEQFPSMWYLDPIVSLVCGFLAFGLGIYQVYVASRIQGLPLFTLKWWIVSQGDGTDEMEGRELSPADFGKEEKEEKKPPKLSEVV